MKTAVSARLMLEQAFTLYQQGDLAGAEDVLARVADHPSALHLMGLVRVRQGRLPEAADLLARSVAAQPKEAQAHFNHGKVLAVLGRHGEAAEAFSQATALDPAHGEAMFGHGKALYAMGDLDGSIAAFRRCLAINPAQLPAKLLLGPALVAAGHPAEAQAVFTQAIAETADPRLLADLHQGAAAADQALGDHGAALVHLEQALVCDPARSRLEIDRGLVLEKLNRFEEAKTAYRTILDHDLVNAAAHRALNDLLYRLGENESFLGSYRTAPRTKELLLDKAQTLLNADRPEEAASDLRVLLSRYGDDKQVLTGLGVALMKSGHLAEATSILERAVECYPRSIDLYCNLSAALARLGDPQKGSVMAVKALTLDPSNQFALAMQGTCWRLLGDERDELLNDYDEFVRVFDLKAPDGYGDMAAFNAELSRSLAQLHPPTREYLGQSLRGGTQTPNDLFAARHPLIEALRGQIEEAVKTYISQISGDADHPFIARRRRHHAFAGSWSSCLRSGGSHINHLHPDGWISSCYYVDVPSAVRDDHGRPGWIKFGQPSFDVGLEPMRAIQPVPGRLVLFPSYMWHGTVPFRDDSVRTTIAFDVVPAEP